MIDFKKLTIEERGNILKTKDTTELLVDRVTLGFENIEQDLQNMNLYTNFELSPSYVDDSVFMQIEAFAPDGEKGKWMRTMIRTYYEGGKVFYKKNDDNSFIVTIKFKD